MNGENKEFVALFSVYHSNDENYYDILFKWETFLYNETIEEHKQNCKKEIKENYLLSDVIILTMEEYEYFQNKNLDNENTSNDINNLPLDQIYQESKKYQQREIFMRGALWAKKEINKEKL